jgi:adenylate cyclase
MSATESITTKSTPSYQSKSKIQLYYGLNVNECTDTMGTIDLSQVSRRKLLSPQPPTPLVYGLRLGNYRLLESIGHGGEAEIWSAWDERRQQVVAMKLISKRDEAPYYVTQASNEFEQQVQVVAGLSHPHVLPLYEFGHNETYYYFVMRYSSAGALADLLLQGPLPVEDVLLFTAQITSALAYLHQQSIVHRDLKPGNILLDSQKRVYLADFGLAKRLALETSPLHTGRGTGVYAPFEQHALQGIIPQSDIYSLGIVIYEMVTGQLPWGGTIFLAEQQHQTQEELPDPRDINPDLPESLTQALRQMTAFRWKERPESAAAAFQLLLDALPTPQRDYLLRLHQTPPPLDEALFTAQDAHYLRHHFQEDWEPDAAAFPARLTHFAIIDSVYKQSQHSDTEGEDTLPRFMLRGALVHDYNIGHWWQALTNPQQKAEVCEQTLALEHEAVRIRLVEHWLNEPEGTFPSGTFSVRTLERLLDMTLKARTWATRNHTFKLLARLIPPTRRWQPIGLSTEADTQLAKLALNHSSQASQAAQMIGRLHSETAVQALLSTPTDDNEANLVLDALQVIQTMAGHLPRIVPVRLRWQIFWRHFQQQWLEDSPGFSWPRVLMGIMVGVVTWLFFLVGLFDGAATRLQDVLLQPYPVSNVVTIVEVNDASLERYGRWDNWPRTLHAELIERLNEAGAKVVVFDFVFDTVTEDDAMLAAAIEQAGNVVQPVLGVGDAIHDQANTVRYEQRVLPAAILLEESAAAGHTNILHDRDGFVRRLPTVMRVDDEVYPSIVLAALQLFLQTGGNPLAIPQPENGWLSFVGRQIPVDGSGAMSIYYAGPPATTNANTFRTVSYQDVLDGAAAPELFRDKIVLVGITATAEPDRYLTPISEGRPMYGVEILANAIETIWSGRFIRPTSAAVTLILMLGLSLGMALTGRSWWGLVWLFGSGVGYFLVVGWLFDKTGLALNLFFPLTAMALSYGAVTAHRLTVTSWRNRELMQLFATRVSPSTASAAIAAVQKGEIDLSGRDEELSAVVVQMRGQAAYAGQYGPEALLALVNHWREFVVAAAFEFEGTIVDLKSDQFLILFNTPLPQPNHAQRAINTVLSLRQRIYRYQQELPTDHPERQIDLSYGLHSGQAIVGFTGSAPRYIYTALGEAINVAAELAVAAAGGQIFLSDVIYDKVKDLLGGLEIHSAIVAGLDRSVFAITKPSP